MWNKKQITEACQKAGIDPADIRDMVFWLDRINSDEGKHFPVKPVNLNSEHHRIIEDNH